MMGAVMVLVAFQILWSLSVLIAALVARACGMRLDRVSIGIGRPLLVTRWGETALQLGLFPVGAFLQIAGRDVTERPIAIEDPKAFHNRPVLLRILPTLVGPVFFALVSALAMTTSYAVFGAPRESTRPLIIGLRPGAPAERAGFAVGDEVLAIEGAPVTVPDVSSMLRKSGDKPVVFALLRDGERVEREVTPNLDNGVPRIGIELMPVLAFANVPFTEAITEGFRFPLQFGRNVFDGYARIVRGSEKAEFAGPVGIVKVLKTRKESERTREALQWIGILSCYFAFFFMLPLPPYPGFRVARILLGWRSRKGKIAGASDLGAVPVSRGWPRVWVIAVNWLPGQVLYAGLVAVGSGAVEVIGTAFFGAMLLALLLPAGQRRFGLSCPKCNTLGARPVWSLKAHAGCIRCGSSWTIQSPT